MSRAIVAMVAALAILGAGCGAVVSSAQSTPNTHETTTTVAAASSLADLRNRPLKLPTVGAGKTCPTTASHDLSPVVNGGKGKGPGFGFGPGPAYLSGIVELYPGGFDNEVWLIEPTYEGPVLIRGQQINGSHVVAFAEPITFPLGGFSSAGSPPPGRRRDQCDHRRTGGPLLPGARSAGHVIDRRQGLLEDVLRPDAHRGRGLLCLPARRARLQPGDRLQGMPALCGRNVQWMPS